VIVELESVTKLTEDGFVTNVTESLTYANADGSDTGMPVITYLVTMEPVDGEEIVVPENALDIYALSLEELIEKIQEIGESIAAKLEAKAAGLTTFMEGSEAQ